MSHTLVNMFTHVDEIVVKGCNLCVYMNATEEGRAVLASSRVWCFDHESWTVQYHTQECRRETMLHFQSTGSHHDGCKWFVHQRVRHTSVLCMCMYVYGIVDFLQSPSATRTVTHMHFTKWPDYGVPKSPHDFIAFREQVRKTGVLESSEGPCVIHCV